MKITPGYVYHIKDEYFTKFAEYTTVQNRDDGVHTRPMFYCEKDTNTGLLLMIPMTSRIDKCIKIRDKQLKKYGECLNLVIGKYAHHLSGFLLQDMLPITEKYISHIHVVSKRPVILNDALRNEISGKIARIRYLTEQRNAKLVFTNIKAIETILLQEQDK